ncbi:hypothetical protein ROG8370_02406 [Roseovarius gaetbuli]|uniref:DUF927 domain-containing protein n=1 Tax=Roseovarius gaetbuli TaxID=1356575 RepID=A0A1X6ZKC8_9RHOB|nr:DUF927 domain-containing protein [Roseovarius gaetbuli]SLN53609.1 hypothetical protein ROG8370_02406 [Roseovarius gaetbuli]
MPDAIPIAPNTPFMFNRKHPMTDIIAPAGSHSPNQNVLAFPHGSKSTATAAMSQNEEFCSNDIPADYASKDDGIYELRADKDGDLVPVRICSPLIMKRRCRNASGRGWGRVVAVRDPDGNWHECILDAREISKSSNAVLAPLFDLGLELAPVTKAADSVMTLLRSWQPDTPYLRFDRLGWTSKTHDAFVLGEGRVLGEALVATDSVSEDLMAAMSSKGTLAAWREEVGMSCVGNSLMMLAVSHAFTGPLLSVLGMNGGGFHLRGLSSRGKSTIQYVATSVWGARPLLQSWDGTPSGFEGIAAAFNDTFLNIEELHKADARTLGANIYMLANGEGRLRAKSNGGLQTPQRWRVPVLSSGEISLEEHMASAGRKMTKGQDVRLINLEADGRTFGAFDDLHGDLNGKLFAERIDRASLENYGHVGPLFVEKLMKNLDEKQNYQNFIDRFCRLCTMQADLSVDGQVHRVLTRFGIAALAGEMATRFDLTGWQPGAAHSAAMELFMDWFEAREGTTGTEINIAVKRTQDYVSKNLDRFLTLGTIGRNPLDGWRDQAWFYIRPECWKAIHDEGNPIEMARLHGEGGLLKTQRGTGLQFRMERGIPERPRVYAVRASALLASTEA